MDPNLKTGSNSYSYHHDAHELLGVWLGTFGVNESNIKSGNEQKSLNGKERKKEINVVTPTILSVCLSLLKQQ